MSASVVTGSNIWANMKAIHPHLVRGHNGQGGEIGDLRRDVAAVLTVLAGLAIVEFTDQGATATNNLKAATATVASPVTLQATDLLAPGLAILAGGARNVTFTTAGSTASDAPATALVTGTDVNGKVQTETVTLAQTAATASGVKAFKTVTSIAYPAADGTGATIAIGVGKAMGLALPPKSRAGLAAIVKEISGGAVVTNGTLDATNHTYTPSASQDGTTDFAIYYEFDGTTLTDPII